MKRLIAFSLLLGLAGCAAQAPQQQPDMANRPATPLECVPAKLPPPRPSPLLNWQAYQANLVMSPRQDLGLIINQAEKAYNEKPTADAVMRLAIALALSNNPQRQERAQRLFNNLRIDPRLKLEEQQFATVQANHLNELRLMRQERTRLEQRLAQEQQAKDALDEKIRALTAIELKMNERQRSEKAIETPAEVNIDDKASKPASSANDTKNPAETPAVKPKDGDSANVPPKDAAVTAPSPEPTQPAKPTAPKTPAPQEPDAKKPEIKATPKSDAKPAPDVSAPATTVAPNPSAPAPASKGQPAPKPSSPATTPDADAPATKP